MTFSGGMTIVNGSRPSGLRNEKKSFRHPIGIPLIFYGSEARTFKAVPAYSYRFEGAKIVNPKAVGKGIGLKMLRMLNVE